MSLRRSFAALLALSIVFGSTNYAVVAAQTPPPGPTETPSDFEEVTPPRLSYLRGDVSFWRPGAEDWGPATLNTPLSPGDTLYASQGGNLELQVAPRAFVRAGDGTQIGLDNQDRDFVQLRVTEGHIAVDVRDLPQGEAIEIGTPNAAFLIERPGFYRADVTQESTTFRAHRAPRPLAQRRRRRARPRQHLPRGRHDGVGPRSTALDNISAHRLIRRAVPTPEPRAWLDNCVNVGQHGAVSLATPPDDPCRGRDARPKRRREAA